MKTYIQPGHSLTVTTPTGGVLSGQGVLIGTLFGIAQYDAVEGAEQEILTEGVVEIPKTSATGCSGMSPTRWSTRRRRRRFASASPFRPPPTRAARSG